MTIADALHSISLYPINPLTVENIAEDCGLSADDTINTEIRSSASFKRAKAKIYQYLAEAPNVTEAGVSYSYTDADRERFRRKADALLDEIGEDGEQVDVGWIGEDY